MRYAVLAELWSPPPARPAIAEVPEAMAAPVPRNGAANYIPGMTEAAIAPLPIHLPAVDAPL